MFAVVEVGAKQFCVKKGDSIETDRQDALVGKEVTLTKVLLVSHDKKIEVGQPYLKGSSIKAEVLRHLRSKKVVSFKYRRRKSSHWHKGHRQNLTLLKIKEIEIGS